MVLVTLNSINQQSSKINFGSFYYSECVINSSVSGFLLKYDSFSFFFVTQSAWSFWMILVSFMYAPPVSSTGMGEVAFEGRVYALHLHDVKSSPPSLGNFQLYRLDCPLL